MASDNKVEYPAANKVKLLLNPAVIGFITAALSLARPWKIKSSKRSIDRGNKMNNILKGNSDK